MINLYPESKNAFHCQLRNAQHTYVLMNRGEEVIFKIYDLLHQKQFESHLANDYFSSQIGENVSALSFVKSGENFSHLLSQLNREGALDDSFMFPIQSPRNAISDSHCLSVLDTLCENIRRKVILSASALDDVDEDSYKSLQCSLTLDFFQDPVFIKCGHTFEKEAIQKHLQRSNTCPECREGVSDQLTPNLSIKKATLELLGDGDPIPTFAKFKQENLPVAQQELRSASTYMEQENFPKALERVREAFKMTKRWEDYAQLPPILDKMGRHTHALLSRIYLARYQIEQNSADSSLQIFQEIRNALEMNDSLRLLLSSVFAGLLLRLRRDHEAEPIIDEIVEQVDILATDERKELFELFRSIYPERPDLYACLAPFEDSTEKRVQSVMIGTLQAIKECNHEKARNMCEGDSPKKRPSYLDALVVARALCEESEPQLDTYTSLLKLTAAKFKESERRKDERKILKTLSILTPSGLESVRLSEIYRAEGKNEKGMDRLKHALETFILLENWEKYLVTYDTYTQICHESNVPLQINFVLNMLLASVKIVALSRDVSSDAILERIERMIGAQLFDVDTAIEVQGLYEQLINYFPYSIPLVEAYANMVKHTPLEYFKALCSCFKAYAVIASSANLIESEEKLNLMQKCQERLNSLVREHENMIIPEIWHLFMLGQINLIKTKIQILKLMQPIPHFQGVSSTASNGSD